jgi:predicted ATPase
MSDEDAALLAQMLSLPNDGRYPALDLAPHQRRQRTLAALARRIEGIARETPVLMVYEDAHWADPSSLEAIGLLVDKRSRPSDSCCSSPSGRNSSRRGPRVRM